jgi:hypothetical protein
MIRDIIVSTIVHAIKSAASKQNPAKEIVTEIGPYKGTNIGFGCNLKSRIKDAG